MNYSKVLVVLNNNNKNAPQNKQNKKQGHKNQEQDEMKPNLFKDPVKVFTALFLHS